MTTKTIASVGLALILLAITPANARTNSQSIFDRHTGGYSYEPITVKVVRHVKVRHGKRYHERPAIPRNYAGLVTVDTAAGIKITVAPSFAPKIMAFIADVVARGYKPRQIHCYSTGGHIRNSMHYSGQACDFNQRGWGKTDGAMYHVADLAHRHGLRDGCTFRDCGHIDAGFRYARRTRYAGG